MTANDIVASNCPADGGDCPKPGDCLSGLDDRLDLPCDPGLRSPGDRLSERLESQRGVRNQELLESAGRPTWFVRLCYGSGYHRLGSLQRVCRKIPRIYRALECRGTDLRRFRHWPCVGVFRVVLDGPWAQSVSRRRKRE